MGDIAVYAKLIDTDFEKIRHIVTEELDKRFVRVTVGSEHTEMPTFTATQYNELYQVYMTVHEHYQQLQKAYAALKAEMEKVEGTHGEAEKTV